MGQMTEYLISLKKLWPHLSKTERKRQIAFMKRIKRKIEKKHPEWKKTH